MKYAKAVVGALAAGLAALGTGLADDHLTQAEIVAAVVAVLVALGAVWGIPNKPPAEAG